MSHGEPARTGGDRSRPLLPGVSGSLAVGSGRRRFAPVDERIGAVGGVLEGIAELRSANGATPIPLLQVTGDDGGRVLHTFKLASPGDLLPPGEMHQVVRALNHGGVCILPSDTSYAFAGNPFIKGVTRLIDGILDRHQAALSLSFGSQRMAERYVDFGIEEYRILDGAGTNEALTVVAPLSADLDPLLKVAIPAALFIDGTLGVRLSSSWIERQVSSEVDGPLTTTAIYYHDGTPVRSFDDAVGAVREGLERFGQDDRKIVAIRHPNVRAVAMSTVVAVDRSQRDPSARLVVHREGGVSRKRLRELVGNVSQRDVEEWT